MPAPAGYIDVAARLSEFFEKYPEGSMQQVSMELREFGGKSWVIYTAAAYRTPTDERPGIGTAWEPVPGPTNFTRDSEVQNAETSAWGRALVAVGADTKQGIASYEEVQNRGGFDQGATTHRPAPQTAQNRQSEANGDRPAPKPRQEVDSDDVATIRKASEMEPGNEFLASLVHQLDDRGTLTDKQIGAGVKSAMKILNAPRPAREYEFAEEEDRF